MNNAAKGSVLRRREEIVRLVRAGSVRSQEDLAESLARRGFEVTQPTLSRDIRELGLAKTPAGYIVPQDAGGADAERDREAKLDGLLREFVRSVTVAGPFVVVKTPPADASPLARAIDEARLPGAVGTIAGDDTIFVAARDAAAAERLARRFRAPIEPRRSRGRGPRR